MDRIVGLHNPPLPTVERTTTKVVLAAIMVIVVVSLIPTLVVGIMLVDEVPFASTKDVKVVYEGLKEQGTTQTT